MKRITPRKDQEKAIEKLKQFKNSPLKEFTLKGVGGTGKTTVIREVFFKKKPAFLSKSQDDFYIPHNVLGLTITHKARLALQESIPNSKTVASGCGFKMHYTPNGDIYFEYQKDSYAEISAAKYIVVDEASMISKSLKENIIKSSPKDSKIIWIGDYHQLPPIKEPNEIDDIDSPVFDIPDQFELKEKIRQTEGDPIAKICDRIVQAIDNNESLDFIKEFKNDINTETSSGVAIATQKASISSFVRNFQNNENVRYTCYRNSSVNKINFLIRKLLFDIDSKFNIEELLYVNNSVTYDGEIIFFTGQELIVKDIKISIYQGFKAYELSVIDQVTKENYKNPLYVLHEDSYQDFNKQLNKLKKNAFKDKKQWIHYFAFKEQFANVSYGYAVTNYKIQGSTLKGCYVDLRDIISVGPISRKQKLQALYVGASRPTQKLILVV